MMVVATEWKKKEEKSVSMVCGVGAERWQERRIIDGRWVGLQAQICLPCQCCTELPSCFLWHGEPSWLVTFRRHCYSSLRASGCCQSKYKFTIPIGPKKFLEFEDKENSIHKWTSRGSLCLTAFLFCFPPTEKNKVSVYFKLLNLQWTHQDHVASKKHSVDCFFCENRNCLSVSPGRFRAGRKQNERHHTSSVP